MSVRIRVGFRHQRGVASLFVIVVLSLLMGLAALISSQTVIVEQRMTANDLRAKEAQQAADAGLALGKSWASQNGISDNQTCPGSAGCPVLPDFSGTTSGSTYSLRIEYRRGDGGHIRVRSVAIGDDASQAMAESWIQQASILNGFFNNAAIVVNGGLSGIKGNPDVYSENAIVYNNRVAEDGDIVPGHFNKKGPALGDITGEAFPTTGSPAWDHVFNLPLSDAIEKAVANGYEASMGALPSEPTDGKGPFYLWDSSSHIQTSFGTADNPVVLIIPSDCPKINGGPRIYGMVYYANPDCGGHHGWGNAQIYGTLITEGPITKVNANTEFHDLNDAGDGFSHYARHAIFIPGTWKDFD